MYRTDSKHKMDILTSILGFSVLLCFCASNGLRAVAAVVVVVRSPRRREWGRFFSCSSAQRPFRIAAASVRATPCAAPTASIAPAPSGPLRRPHCPYQARCILNEKQALPGPVSSCGETSCATAPTWFGFGLD
jgi:hypothetical protein